MATGLDKQFEGEVRGLDAFPELKEVCEKCPRCYRLARSDLALNEKRANRLLANHRVYHAPKMGEGGGGDA